MTKTIISRTTPLNNMHLADNERFQNFYIDYDVYRTLKIPKLPECSKMDLIH